MRKEFNFNVRLAVDADMQAIADSHQASIQEIGPEYYQGNALEIWGRKRPLEVYREARDKFGEIFFVAEPIPRQADYLHGFSGYRLEDGKHRLAGFYVRGTSARQGIGTALLKAVEDLARKSGGTDIHVEAALSGEAFYCAAGFCEVSRRIRPMGSTTINVIDMIKPL